MAPENVRTCDWLLEASSMLLPSALQRLALTCFVSKTDDEPRNPSPARFHRHRVLAIPTCITARVCHILLSSLEHIW